MLKIKDETDLRMLEKYGFIKLENEPRGHKYIKFKYDKNGTQIYSVYINKDNYIRIHTLYGVIIAGSLQTVLYDLIKDGLVEKVEE